MTIKDRVYSFIEYKGLSVKKFEEVCRLSNGYISSMRKGFGRDKLNNVLTAFPDLNRDWLLYGEGGMLNIIEDQPAESHPATIDPDRINRLIDTVCTQQETIARQCEMLEYFVKGHGSDAQQGDNARCAVAE